MTLVVLQLSLKGFLCVEPNSCRVRVRYKART